MNKAILVSTASGTLGRAIVSAALQAGLDVRQGLRNPDKANPAAPAVRLDYGDPATIGPALVDVSALVLMAPPLDAAMTGKLSPVIAKAKEAGVEQIVFISAFGANLSEQAPLRVVEHEVMKSGIPYTILRPNFFSENFSTGFLSASIRTQGAIFLAAGDGKTSFISIRDIAAAVLAAIQKPLTGQEFDLTGPEPLDHAEVARIISNASGRPVTYHSLTEEQMLAGARAAGMPEPEVQYLGVLYQLVRAGYSAPVSADFERITGRQPRGFAEFARTEAWT